MKNKCRNTLVIKEKAGVNLPLYMRYEYEKVKVMTVFGTRPEAI